MSEEQGTSTTEKLTAVQTEVIKTEVFSPLGRFTGYHYLALIFLPRFHCKG